MLELNKLYNMDCMEGMKQFPDKYFELAIVDPPYGIGAGSKKFINRSSANERAEKFYKDNDWDKNRPSKEYFDELFRVSKNQIIWGGNYFGLPPTRCFLIWDKGEGFYNRTYAECELAWTSFDKNTVKLKHDPLANRDYVGKIHPTQKPIKLYEWLLSNYANKGDKILDTHVGSASSLIACYNLGFNYIGFEIDKDYYEAATKRLEAVKSQVRFTV